MIYYGLLDEITNTNLGHIILGIHKVIDLDKKAKNIWI